MALISACACCGVTPGLSRPIIFKLRMSRTSGTSSVVSGTQRSALIRVSSVPEFLAENEGGNLKFGGMMPTTV